MARNDTIKSIATAFASVSPLEPGMEPLSATECRRLIDDLSVMQPAHLHWVLPQVLVDFLRFPERPRAQWDLADVIAVLNAPLTDAEDFYADLAPCDADYFKKGFEMLRRGHRDAYRNFTRKQSTAIVAFLREVADWPGIKLGAEKDWRGAVDYWSRRSNAEGRRIRPRRAP